MLLPAAGEDRRHGNGPGGEAGAGHEAATRDGHRLTGTTSGYFQVKVEVTVWVPTHMWAYSTCSAATGAETSSFSL